MAKPLEGGGRHQVLGALVQRGQVAAAGQRAPRGRVVVGGEHHVRPARAGPVEQLHLGPEGVGPVRVAVVRDDPDLLAGGLLVGLRGGQPGRVHPDGDLGLRVLLGRGEPVRAAGAGGAGAAADGLASRSRRPGSARRPRPPRRARTCGFWGDWALRALPGTAAGQAGAAGRAAPHDLRSCCSSHLRETAVVTAGSPAWPVAGWPIDDITHMMSWQWSRLTAWFACRPTGRLARLAREIEELP